MFKVEVCSLFIVWFFIDLIVCLFVLFDCFWFIIDYSVASVVLRAILCYKLSCWFVCWFLLLCCYYGYLCLVFIYLSVCLC